MGYTLQEETQGPCVLVGFPLLLNNGTPTGVLVYVNPRHVWRVQQGLAPTNTWITPHGAGEAVLVDEPVVRVVKRLSATTTPFLLVGHSSRRPRRPR